MRHGQSVGFVFQIAAAEFGRVEHTSTGAVGTIGSIDNSPAAATFMGADLDWSRLDAFVDQEAKRHTDCDGRGPNQFAEKGSESHGEQPDEDGATHQVDKGNDPALTIILGFARCCVDCFSEFVTQQLELQFADHTNVGSADSGKKSLHTVQQPVGIIEIELALMSPSIAEGSELGNETSLKQIQFPTEDSVPLVPHHGQECVSIPFFDVIVEFRVGTVAVEAVTSFQEPVVAMDRTKLTVNERTQSIRQRFERSGDVVLKSVHRLTRREKVAA